VSPDLAPLARAVGRHGFILRGGFHPGPGDGAPGNAGTLVMVGNAGPAMWAAFRAAVPQPSEPDPLDAWTRRVLAAVAGELGAEAVFPFDGPPYLPFQRWAMRADAVFPSPIGPLIHPVYGLWHAYRAALLFAGRLALPEKAAATSPCEGCAGKPCLAACPVSALSPGAYDVPACVGFLDAPAGADCLALGCAARRACPVGREYVYAPAQAAFHMAAFRAANRPRPAPARPEICGQPGNAGHINPVMSGLPFIKMHGLGNDFVVLDGRAAPVALTAARARAIADRHTGVGCDQIILVEPARKTGADAFMRILNADGGEVGACGNATRCVAALAMAEKGSRSAIIETVSGLLAAEAAGEGIVAVDMGPAGLDWRDIPLSEAMDTLRLAVDAGPLREATAVGMGNPHAVFFVDDAEAVPMETWGPVVERHPLFPERTNVEAVEVIAPDRVRMRVWERGVGVTRACGTGACAAVVAAHRRGFTGRAAHVVLDGGTLLVEWRTDGRVRMTGPVTTSFRGVLEPALLESAR